MVDTIAPNQSTLESIFENQVFTGTIDTAGDIDWIKVTVSSGVHTFNLVGDPYFGNTLSDPLLKLYDSNGALLAQDDDNGAGSNSYFQYDFGLPGTYYVAVSGYFLSSPSTYTGDYWLNVTNGDIADDTTTHGVVRPGMSVGGYITAATFTSQGYVYDHDWYRVTLKAGQTYTILAEGNAGANGPISDPIEAMPEGLFAYVMDSTGTNTLGGGTAQERDEAAVPFQFTATYTGTYYIGVGSNEPYNGNYLLSVSGAVDINHRPTGVSKTVTIAEDHARTFTLADFGYSDSDGDPVYGVRIMSLPSVGTLTTYGTTVKVGDYVWPDSLKWTPPANFNGTVSFKFALRDAVTVTKESGTDLNPKTLTIKVTPVDDAPVITSNGGGAGAIVHVNENTTAVTTVHATDIDSAVSYFISGADAAMFKISTSGVLSFKKAPDFEVAKDHGGNNVYDVLAIASSGSLSDTQALQVVVNNLLGAKITGSKKNETVDAKHKMGGQFATVEPDTIDGKAGSDKINGLGGSDVLTGGKGNDRFVFNSKLGAGNVDTITDFAHDHDLILLDDKIFKTIGTSLTSDEFYAHSKAHKAHDASDRIVYDTKHGKLYYDSDGAGGHDAVLFAKLSHHPTLDSGDFTIV